MPRPRSHLRGPYRAALLLAMMLALGPASAVAGDTPDGEALQALIVEGQTRFRAGRYGEALAAFQRVTAQHPRAARDARLQWNIARCYEKLGAYDDAIAAFELTEKLSAPGRRRDRARAKVEALRAAHFGQLEVNCPVGWRVRITGLEGEQACPARWTLARAGAYRGALVGGRGAAVEFDVDVAAGRTTTVRPSLPAPVEGPSLAPWAWAAIGVGAAALGGATYYYLDGLDAAERAGDATTDFDYDRWSARTDASRIGHYSTLGVGGALLVVGGVLFALDGAPADGAAGRPTGGGWSWAW